MEKAKKIILNATAYTVVILVLFYLYALLGNLTQPAIKFGTFLIVLVFGFVISLANMIFELKNLHYALKLLIHYAALLAAFIAVFVIAGNLTISGPASVLSAIIIFSFLYGVIYALSYGVKSAIRSVDKKPSQNKNPEAKKSTYKPLYKDEDRK